RVLRYRNLVQRQAVQMKNRISGLLMETGVSYNKLRLHRMGYFEQLLSTNEEISDSVRPLLQLCREHIDRSIRLDRTLLRSLEQDPMLSERLQRLRTVPGVGPITALTWVLEVGDTSRLRSIKQAISYCGLCGAEKSSADKVLRTPISKQRNSRVNPGNNPESCCFRQAMSILRGQRSARPMGGSVRALRAAKRKWLLPRVEVYSLGKLVCQ
ncbi:MAG: transposase, partial [Acidobacteriaceae bacterium]